MVTLFGLDEACEIASEMKHVDRVYQNLSISEFDCVYIGVPLIWYNYKVKRGFGTIVCVK